MSVGPSEGGGGGGGPGGGPRSADDGLSATLLGIAGSHGVVVAPAIVVGTARARHHRRRVRPEGVDGETERFHAAVAAVAHELKEKIADLDGSVGGSILEAYLHMVGDPMLDEHVCRHIRTDRKRADWAVFAATEAFADKLGALDDPYMRERRHDIEFVGDLLLRALGGGERPTFDITEPSIVVAHDLSPADTAAMVGQPVVGFITEVGSRTSHTSIMARALEIPAVVGVVDALGQIDAGDVLALDGLRGRVIVNPDDEEVDDVERRRARYLAWTQELDAHRDDPARTKDDVALNLRANIELPEEAAIARTHGAEGVGLYRTEYLYVSRSAPPDEDEQLAVYRRVLHAMGDAHPITLRTFDIGGDKFVTTFPTPDELNPMLGLRAVRLALAEPELLMTQLRAMLRASAFGPVRVMVPLVATLTELREVRARFETARAQVREAGHAMADHIPLGVMIEVPAAAMMARHFAVEADFMSIGTNDLVQYALAVDRTNRALAHLASPFDPAILALVQTVVAAGREHSCPVSVCGEMASEPYGALLLLGLGVVDFSMESMAIPEIKEAAARIPMTDCVQVAELALQMATADEVVELLSDTFEPRLHDVLTGQPESISFSSAPSSSPSRASRSLPRRRSSGQHRFDLPPPPDDEENP
ncbi:MAG: phosphoenolpyruvate--protein phosphotransferase [Myxococcota bacterium]